MSSSWSIAACLVAAGWASRAALAQQWAAPATSSSTECACLDAPQWERQKLGISDPDYGSYCAPWDVGLPGRGSDDCMNTTERGTLRCCGSWCFVDPRNCPSALPFGHPMNADFYDVELWYSVEACPDDLRAMDACPAQKKAKGGCRCTGSNAGAGVWKFGHEYGTYCRSWDAENCGDWWAPGPIEGPNGGPDVWQEGAHALNRGQSLGSWCCQPWCYVDPKDCPGDAHGRSALALGLYWSYVACEEDAEAAYFCPWSDEVALSKGEAWSRPTLEGSRWDLESFRGSGAGLRSKKGGVFLCHGGLLVCWLLVWTGTLLTLAFPDAAAGGTGRSGGARYVNGGG